MFKYITPKTAKELLSVPSCSNYESEIISWLINWGSKNGVKSFIHNNNVYFEKGELKEGEFYPCVTSHTDTVQSWQKQYVVEKKRIVINESVKDGLTYLTTTEGGIGADCKIGIVCCLEMIKRFDKIKACFFYGEELGMVGSKKLKLDWFDDVGYVISFDSPELNRASYCCWGTDLMSKTFLEETLKPLCKKFGVDSFRSEPFTDVVQIRQKTGLTCMNFGSGGYDAHSHNEYVIVEHTDKCCEMATYLISQLGKIRWI